jgi:alpha-tubulin suppressor-like RCC1 family protein
MFQLGNPERKTDDCCFKFEAVKLPRNHIFTKMEAWNFSVVVTDKGDMYCWGMLGDSKSGKILCIRVPELVANLKVEQVAVGESLAIVIEQYSGKTQLLGVNANGELGLGDTEPRKKFTPMIHLQDKPISILAIGKSDFVLAVGKQLESTIA